jgi:putative resolvase
MTLLTSSEAATELGICYNTLRNWVKDGKIQCLVLPGGHSRYDVSSILAGRRAAVPTSHRTTAQAEAEAPARQRYVYCRVSSNKQKDDLGRQVQSMQTKYPNHIIVKDVGSGINFKRRGLRTLLEQSMSGRVEEVVVAHRDRLCRFGFELLEFIFSHNGTRLTVEDGALASPEQELAQDVLAILQVFSCRQQGKRRYRRAAPAEEGDGEQATGDEKQAEVKRRKGGA